MVRALRSGSHSAPSTTDIVKRRTWPVIAVLTFDESAEASLDIKQFGSEQVVRAPIGLDGVYRMSMSEHSLPQGYRGSWADAQTFAFEYDNIANNDHATYRLRFEGDRVLLSGQETAHELGTQFEGRLQEP